MSRFLPVPVCLFAIFISASANFQTKIGDTCTTTQDCINGGIQGSVRCEDAGVIPLCLCNKGFIPDTETKNQCLPIQKEPGQRCKTTAQCTNREGLGKLSECVKGTCQCFDSNSPENPKEIIFDAYSKKCAYKSTTLGTLALIGDSCVSTEECTRTIKGPVQCRDMDANKQCSCDSGYVPNDSNTECVLEETTTPSPKLIGDSCVSTEECTRTIKGPVQCRDRDANKQCSCDSGYVPNDSNTECILEESTTSPPKLIGDSCVSTEECTRTIKGPVQCRDRDANKQCTCDSGYVANDLNTECVLERSTTPDEGDGGNNAAIIFNVSKVIILLNLAVTLKLLII